MPPAQPVAGHMLKRLLSLQLALTERNEAGDESADAIVASLEKHQRDAEIHDADVLGVFAIEVCAEIRP